MPQTSSPVVPHAADPSRPAAARRHLLSLADLSDDELYALVHRSSEHARGAVPLTGQLGGRVVGTYFRTTSTRTRTAFSVAALRLGAQLIAYGPKDLQENTGETADDTGRVLGLMLDGLVARTSASAQELRSIAAWDTMSVVNAMTEDEHPTQGVTDLSAMLTAVGRLEGLRVLYVGEGNNTAVALALALTRYPGAELHLRTPPGYGLPPAALRRGQEYAAAHGAVLDEQHHMDGLPPQVDIVYTTRWQTTGTTKPDPEWRQVFRPFQVDAALMDRCPAAVFMHDLPAHRGEEVEAGVLDGDRSIAFQQAAHKLYGAMAVLEWYLA
ncbi:ornithine carbamoyltransferase [Streptacidiphilus sp. P02-A3a]|uniref:ornithine carbamoyltransferase n=1 Tax=Streptacidiphilus sp. P02-A3a TaxID=2704468 RepID=UPI0015F9CB1F|nr:ornithine carbamoyltransferase [Streptacidiphilus sp. P02-A3a]QMU71699.1 ornithine carbamoyltransferase [Streptacidiphilus sp. P02-A3a]